MKNILQAPFIRELCDITENMYRLGWDERNGGNISVLLTEEEVSEYLNPHHTLRTIPVDFDASEFVGRCLAVTGTGKCFRSTKASPQTCLGVVCVKNKSCLSLLWGFEGGGMPTSELAAHFLIHAARIKEDPEHRVVMHAHPTNTVAMTFIHTLDERAFTKTLWRMMTECIIVFPDGIGVLPFMVCGTLEIGYATAEKMKTHRVVIWSHHGIFGTGKSIDDAFGLIETIEKAAEIFIKIADKRILQTMTDQDLRATAARHGVDAPWLEA